MTLPKVVLFDMDNTLVDHQYASDNALLHIRDTIYELRDCSLTSLKELWRRDFDYYWLDVARGNMTLEESWRRRFQKLFIYLGNNNSSDLSEKAASEYSQTYISKIKPIPGAIDLLKLLRNKGIGIGVITNNTERMQSTKLRDCGLAEYIDSVLTSESCGILKPDPRIFSIALQRFNATPAESVMVGDSYEQDISGAMKSGIFSVLFNRNEDQLSSEMFSVPVLTSFFPTSSAFDIIVRAVLQ